MVRFIVNHMFFWISQPLSTNQSLVIFEDLVPNPCYKAATQRKRKFVRVKTDMIEIKYLAVSIVD